MKKPRYTAGQVIAALQKTKGLTYLAAQELQCDPDTIQNYCKRYPSVEAAKVAERGKLLDVCELRLWDAVQNGEHWAITFDLMTLGRRRGYVERLDLSLTIEAAAQKVADQFGLTPEAVLAEAKLLLLEVDHDHE